MMTTMAAPTIGPSSVAAAARDHHQQHLGRAVSASDLRADELVVVDEQQAGDAGPEAREQEGEEADQPDIVAERGHAPRPGRACRAGWRRTASARTPPSSATSCAASSACRKSSKSASRRATGATSAQTPHAARTTVATRHRRRVRRLATAAPRQAPAHAARAPRPSHCEPASEGCGAGAAADQRAGTRAR